MPRIVSFSPNSAAPKAANLKALAARQKMLEEQAAQNLRPREMPSPWQGAAQMAMTLGNTLAQARRDKDEAYSRDVLAKIRAGIDPTKGATPEQVAAAAPIDEDFANRLEDRSQSLYDIGKERDYRTGERVAGQQFTTQERIGGQNFTASQNAADRLQRQQLQDDAQQAEKERQVDLFGHQDKQLESQQQFQTNERVAKEIYDTTVRTEEEKNKGVIHVTGEEAKRLNLDPTRQWEVNVSSGMATDQSPKGGGGLDVTLPDGTRISTGDAKADAEGAKQNAKNEVNLIDEERKKADAAINIRTTADIVRKNLDNAGPMGPVVGKAGGLLGDTLEAVGAKSAADYLGLGSSASRALVGSGGMQSILDNVSQMKGAVSDYETRMLELMGPTMSKTRAGAEMILNVRDRMAERQVQKTTEMENWYEKNRSLAGFNEYWQQYTMTHPIILANEDGSLRFAKPGETIPMDQMQQQTVRPPGTTAAVPTPTIDTPGSVPTSTTQTPAPAPAPGPGPAKPDQYQVGQTYKDAQGNSATYLGNGQWKEQ